MNIKQNYNDHCWHVRGYAVLSLGLRLRTAIAIVIVRQLLGNLRNEVIRGCSHRLLNAGTASLTVAGDAWRRSGFSTHVPQLLCQYEATAEPGARGRLFKVIKERAASWRKELDSNRQKDGEVAVLLSYLQAVGDTTRNPLVAITAFSDLVAGLQKVIQAAKSGWQASQAHERELETQIVADLQTLDEREHRYSQFTLQQQTHIPTTQSGSRQIRKRWARVVISGGVAFFLVLMLGYAVSAALMSALLVTIITRLVGRRTKTANESGDGTQQQATTESGIVGRMPERLKQKLLAYGSTVEETAVLEAEALTAEELLGRLQQSALADQVSAIERAVGEMEFHLLQEWDKIPQELYCEVDPGSVELTGRELAATLASRWLKSQGSATAADRVLHAFERARNESLMPATLKRNGTALAQELLAAAQDAFGKLSLEDVLDVICDTPAGQQMFVHWLQTLLETACAASNLRRDVRLDSALSVARLTVGLPKGDADPLSLLVTQRFSKATVVLSSISDGIEIVFDLRNVPVEAWLTHALTREHYESANSWERDRLWHFPPCLATESQTKKLLPTAGVVARLEQQGEPSGNGHLGEQTLPSEITAN